MQLLDNFTSDRPQLSSLELFLLTASVLAAAASPVAFSDPAVGLRVAEVVAPASAAFTASIGISAEYVGKVAVADGKEVAAATIQCAAEAEGLLANAERVKAVTPLCVGIGTVGASLALVVPAVIDSFGLQAQSQLATELYLFCPLVSVLSAAVAGLALQEIRQFSNRAISVGNRRFSRSGIVGRTWLSATEQIGKRSSSTTERWRSFALGVLPAPFIGALIPDVLATKSIVVAALAAMQAAYFLAQAESTLARATDAVALKSRSSAVCDAYANQGARVSAVLPFTSALSAFSAAATAAVVELPWLEGLASVGAPWGPAGQVVLVSIFPALGALFAASASVSKSRCEVDAEAATQAASTLALEYDSMVDPENDPILNPLKSVLELILVTVKSSWKSAKKSATVRRMLGALRWIAGTVLRRGADGEQEDRSNGTPSVALA